ncbi:MAG: MFS transporter [Xanthobacteraceae bacterium]|nr:MFS transporter [Xanthobacteraceae bacterium]
MIGPLRALLLLWLAGIALRLTILAVPPVIPLIHNDLHLSETQVGILSGLPMVLFAGAAIAGSLMIARLGALTALLIGLVLCAAGSMLRGIGPHVTMLYFGTVVTAFGVAVMQPSLPPLVRAWVPQRIGFATAVYTNGLLIGEILPAALTIPLVLPMLRQSWQWDFVLWAVPVAIIAAILFALAPRAPAVVPTAASRRWMPDFRNPLIWRIGLLLGSVNATYFSMNGFLPDYLTHTGRPDLINSALTALNLGQLPASFLLLASADRMVRTMWSYLVCGLICLVSVLAIVFLGGIWVVIGCAVWGCFGAAVLVLVLALPPLISPPEDVHRVSAGMFTISYSCAVIVPIASGVLWDLTGWTLSPFIPIGICALVLIGLAPTIVLREKSAAT